ncbi:hypothetical protein EXM98_04745 [Clostridium botulinum]|nr:hypothetical protein [Clostridium botulinum]NFC60544.1 hypothetical protein [Clostridium botulinum]NFC68552.1 hypothetical protein [Clostridium botulinum]NFC86266.1 hypothetical protein [Clostridium botulinum]NFE37171.1 hypothetical protein [Clostridium botulinum]
MKTIIEILGSIVVIVFKLLLIPSIIFRLLLIIFRLVFAEKISDSFVMYRGTNRIEQSISFKMYIKIWKNDYYANRKKLLEEIKKVYITNSILKNEKKKGKVVRCETNLIIYRYILLKQIEKHNLLIDDASKIKIFQPIEKLTLMNSWVIWKNIFNTKFWKYIFREEIVKKYYFKVTN